jgi:hypothetical protein
MPYQTMIVFADNPARRFIYYSRIEMNNTGEIRFILGNEYIAVNSVEDK